MLDATNGQNAIAQARQFHEALGVTGIALTKLDGTAKGGVVIGISRRARHPGPLRGRGREGRRPASLRPGRVRRCALRVATAARRRVLLFDVDGTLIHAGRRGAPVAGAGPGRTVRRGGAAPLSGMRLDGMTDRLIVREVLVALERPFDDALCDGILDELRAGPAARRSRAPGFRVLPGRGGACSRRSRRAARPWGSAPGT